MPSMNFLGKAERAFRKSHTSRTAAATGVRGSATSANTSGTVETREQWVPASRNTIDLIEGWDQVLTAIDPNANQLRDETIVESFQEIENHLPHCKLPPPDHFVSHQPDADTRQLLFLCAYASKAVYGKSPGTDTAFLQQHSFRLLSKNDTPASFTGSIKHLQLSTFSSQTEDGKTGLVAIRGSAAMVDWLVNFNGESVDAPFLEASVPQESGESRKAHRGFLRVAESMEPAVTDAINTLAGECDRIVLTGHSAGAGVAALLFLHYLKRRTFANVTLSCITFAAPPIVSNPEVLPTSPPSATFLSVVNENDPVPRADITYILSFADLYAKYRSGTATLSEWSPPTPSLHIPKESTIAVLRPTQENEEVRAKMHEIDIAQYEKTVAFDAEMHRMQWYVEQTEASIQE